MMLKLGHAFEWSVTHDNRPHLDVGKVQGNDEVAMEHDTPRTVFSRVLCDGKGINRSPVGAYGDSCKEGSVVAISTASRVAAVSNPYRVGTAGVLLGASGFLPGRYNEPRNSPLSPCLRVWLARAKECILD